MVGAPRHGGYTSHFSSEASMDFLGGAAAKLQREQKKRAEEAQRKQQKERAIRERAAAKAAAHEARAEQVCARASRHLL